MVPRKVPEILSTSWLIILIPKNMGGYYVTKRSSKTIINFMVDNIIGYLNIKDEAYHIIEFLLINFVGVTNKN